MYHKSHSHWQKKPKGRLQCLSILLPWLGHCSLSNTVEDNMKMKTRNWKLPFLHIFMKWGSYGVASLKYKISKHVASKLVGKNTQGEGYGKQNILQVSRDDLQTWEPWHSSWFCKKFDHEILKFIFK